MTLVAGVDSSTQSTKVVVCEADTGRVVRQGRAPHPDEVSPHPESWWTALSEATDGLLSGVDAIGVAAQQHGLVALGEDGKPVRNALLWNDTRAAQQASDLVAELGGPQAAATALGTVPIASLTVSKLRWMAEHEPELADRVGEVALPHDWLTQRLTGGELVTDRGDVSGTGYFSPAEGDYRRDVLRMAFDGRQPRLPRVLAPNEPAGVTSQGHVVAAGTGDNMGAALGLNLAPGDVVVSLGTSGTAFAVSERATADGTGAVAGFADATGRFLPLVCTLNAARVVTATAAMLGVDFEGFDALACRAEPGAGGLVLLPYLDGERTPNLPGASGTVRGLRRDNMCPENLARAAVEGMLCGLADGVDALRANGVAVRRVLLIGGAARSASVRSAAPMIFDAPVRIPPAAEYVALGAARQAAWAWSGSSEAPEWPMSMAEELDLSAPDIGRSVRTAYREARDQVHPELDAARVERNF